MGTFKNFTETLTTTKSWLTFLFFFSSGAHEGPKASVFRTQRGLASERLALS
jgi:hypothetical protein